MAELEARVKACEQKIAELTEKEKTIVAFSAVADHGGVHEASSKPMPLVYNKLITNIGGGYNKSTGVFVAHVAGVYCFILSYHAGGNKYANVSLYKNEHLIVTTSDQEPSKDPTNNGGNAVVLELKEKDHVYVRMGENSHVWAGGYHTTFSGFLVSQMRELTPEK
ncbi:cerebellin-3 [Lates calcarifer]|uniref:Cerebellin-3 n=1 Tax=Lates calcarifer TaxID=8187 RepID=A0AAJ7Q0A4_LATCA|nr:cerebellin-3 [Lates calcarifer]